VSTVNVDPLLSLVVREGLATMRELDEYYSYEDALNMAEILNVRSYNDWLAHKDAQRKQV
jgi:hypothetical protein